MSWQFFNSVLTFLNVCVKIIWMCLFPVESWKKHFALKSGKFSPSSPLSLTLFSLFPSLCFPFSLFSLFRYFSSLLVYSLKSTFLTWTDEFKRWDYPRSCSCLVLVMTIVPLLFPPLLRQKGYFHLFPHYCGHFIHSHIISSSADLLSTVLWV